MLKKVPKRRREERWRLTVAEGIEEERRKCL